MAEIPRTHPHSTAKIAGHPIHPMLIPFPIAFFIGTLATDVVFAISGDPFWARMAFYLLSAGLVMAALAALAGLTDFLGDGQLRRLKPAWHHMIGNVIVVLLEVTNWLMRGGPRNTDFMPGGLFLSIAVTLILFYTAWRGADLVYRHRAGIVGDAE